MTDELLSTKEAARRLGIAPASLYDWLAQSDGGTFIIRGKPVTIDYLQGGPKGQGRIKIESREVERLKAFMRVRPKSPPSRRRPTKSFPLNHITVPLGRPDDC